MNDYYTVLKISPNATADELRKQYISLVKAWHPDKFQDPQQKARAEEQMKRINAAYAVLGDPEQRARYDRERKANAAPPPAAKPYQPAGAQSYPPPQAWKPAGNQAVNGNSLSLAILCLFLITSAWIGRNSSTIRAATLARQTEVQKMFISIEQTWAVAQTATHRPTQTAGLSSSRVMPARTELPSTRAPARLTAASLTSPAIDPAMVYIPEGRFWMGAAPGDPVASDEEKPGREVHLSGYWIDTTEVTNAMFADFVAQTGYTTDAERLGSGWVLDLSKNNWEETAGADWRHPYGPDSTIAGLEQHPVVQVSWNDAAAYCRWRSARLPTEAEWEKAARGTDQRIYPWGDTSPSGTLANFADRSLAAIWSDLAVSDGFPFTAPVGSYPSGASPYGLFDMAGNVWEWVQDWYDPGYYGAAPDRNPAGPGTGSAKVLRGGCWGDPGRNLRVSLRYRFEPDYRIDDFGFRCAR